jgi:hypothetical protein
MVYEERFSDGELEQIISEGFIYMCACPAKVAETVRSVRSLYRYQLACLENPDNDDKVHKAIAKSAIMTHAQLQDCMDEILILEKWDRKTLQMPADLRVKQLKAITDD